MFTKFCTENHAGDSYIFKYIYIYTIYNIHNTIYKNQKWKISAKKMETLSFSYILDINTSEENYPKPVKKSENWTVSEQKIRCFRSEYLFSVFCICVYILFIYMDIFLISIYLRKTIRNRSKSQRI